MQANPVPERQLDALHRLLRHLSSHADVASLARLPLAGTIALGGAGMIVQCHIRHHFIVISWGMTKLHPAAA